MSSIINEHVAAEHDMRRRINDAVKMFDDHVAVYDLHRATVSVHYDHNEGDGLWTCKTWVGGNYVNTAGAVLHDTMLEHMSTVVRGTALRKLPSLLPPPATDGETATAVDSTY